MMQSTEGMTDHAGMNDIIITASGAEVIGTPNFEDFCERIMELYDDKDKAEWGIPDLIVWAEDNNAFSELGEEVWYQAIDVRRMNEGTLANRKSIVRKFPKAKRRWKLSQRHYAQLTSLMPDNEALAFELLEQAVRTDMTSVELLNEKKRRLKERVLDTFETSLVYKVIDGRGYFVSLIDPPAWIAEGYKADVTLKEAA